MTLLAVENLMVRRGGRPVLDAVTAALPAGAFVAVIGANGAGKSTLLAALAGLTAPDGGTVSLGGRPLSSLRPRALAVQRAYLPQNPRCDWPIAVERLVALGLTPVLPAFGALAPAMLTRIDAALADFDLTTRRDQPADTLSGGELARAMLARALVADPKIILADEPLTGLDPRHALDSARRLRGLADAGKLVVASMHDLTLAARYATHVLALRDGQLCAFGSTDQTLTPALLTSVFDLPGLILGKGDAAYVDFAAGD
jgi:iron complex transport system ATP-binding protein